MLYSMQALCLLTAPDASVQGDIASKVPSEGQHLMHAVSIASRVILLPRVPILVTPKPALTAPAAARSHSGAIVIVVWYACRPDRACLFKPVL